MKTVVEQLADAESEIKTLQASIITLNQAAVVDVAKVEALAGQVKTLEAAHVSLVEAHKLALGEVSGKLTAEISAHAETVKALDEAKKKLADPAYKMASAEGDKKPVGEGGAPAATDVSLNAQMKAISDPIKRAAFYHANTEAIKAELK